MLSIEVVGTAYKEPLTDLSKNFGLCFTSKAKTLENKLSEFVVKKCHLH
jgi:hypothetical protein